MDVFLTGCAGFIGFHAARSLLASGHRVFGYDSINDYYDVKHKHARLEILRSYGDFEFVQGDLCDEPLMGKVWRDFNPSHVLHLAAQAGVRYSIEKPNAYIESNIVGFQNVIELVRATKPTNFVYASSSSVYGGLTDLPFKETLNVSKPISLYAATKRSNELVAYTYSHLFNAPTTGLRFFTVYGPYARPDMAMFKFANLMAQGKPIPVYNQGKMVRDFTYIDDIVDGVLRCLTKVQYGQIYNLGRGQAMDLSKMISLLEAELGLEAQKEFLPMQAGDVAATIADISKAGSELGFKPKTDLVDGVRSFANWYKTSILRSESVRQEKTTT